jgi:hypothetical protein
MITPYKGKLLAQRSDGLPPVVNNIHRFGGLFEKEALLLIGYTIMQRFSGIPEALFFFSVYGSRKGSGLK